jgi:hypothetical protein
MVYGHLLMARSCIAQTLAEKVADGILSEEVALDLAQMLLDRNAVELYGIGEHRGPE